MKTKVSFRCDQCGATSPKWTGRCSVCGAWNSLVEEIGSPSAVRNSGLVRKESVSLSALKTESNDRLPTGIGEVDRVFGGSPAGLVPGSVILLSGDPGIGKSTLVLQVAEKLAGKSKVVYVSGEESPHQIKLRYERLKTKSDIEIASNYSLEELYEHILASKPDVVVVDSIQTIAAQQLPQAPGSITQITNATHTLVKLAKEHGIVMIIIGHVTKEGHLAGPRALEHLVDVVLYLEGDRYANFRILRGVKNRFGSTNEVGIFDMTEAGLMPVENPSASLLSERSTSSGSAITAMMEGTRPLLVEVQGLTNESLFGYPKRTASGIDLNRLQLIVAILSKRAGLQLANQDIYVNVVGGIKLAERAGDLPVALAVASALKNLPLSDDLICFGELGLSGEIRTVNYIDRRVNEAASLGYKQAIVPPSAKLSGSKLKILQPKNIAEAIGILFNQNVKK